MRLPGVVLPSVAVAGASALVMGPANWLFISCAGWGLAGAAASYFVASVASLLVSVAFVVRLEQSRPVHARCSPHLRSLILRVCPLPRCHESPAWIRCVAPLKASPASSCVKVSGLMLPMLMHRSWHGWSWDAFRGWGTYFRVAVPATTMLCLDWWSYEAVILLAGISQRQHPPRGA